MKDAEAVYYYLFKGNWLGRFEELNRMIEKNKIRSFELWVPFDKGRDHHIVISRGAPLTETFCLVKTVWKTSEDVFLSYYGYNREHFTIHKGGRDNDKRNGCIAAESCRPV